MSDDALDPLNFNLNFDDEVAPIDAHNVSLEFEDDAVGAQYITTNLFDSLEFGGCTVKSSVVTLYATGFDSFAYGGHKLIQSKFITPAGFDAAAFGNQKIINKNQTIYPAGFIASTFTASKIYNLLQFIKPNGLNAAQYGAAYLQGGVKYIEAKGFSSNVFGATTVINTKADQYLQLSGKGIAPPALPSPNVSPRILYPFGIKADGYGQPLVQRNPSPDGFINSSYGDAWVSHSPRYLLVGIGDTYESGYPTVYDPTQKIYLADKGIEGGIFGDIRLQNKNLFISALGFNSQQFSDFATAYSNLRVLQAKGFDSLAFGDNTIHNKTPSIAPQGFDSLSGLAPSIGYAIRYVYPTGFDLLKSGIATLTKPPTISPNGFDALRFGAQFISNRIRTLKVVGKDSLAISEPVTWFTYRHLAAAGFTSDYYGTPRIEHGRRTILAQGANSAVFGNNAWLSYAVRQLAPKSIYKEFASNHLVGGLQYINGQGFVATEFGTRIIPESQTVYAQGFSNSFGLTSIDLKTNYIKPNGFLTTGQEGSKRFGTAKFWNKRQYVVQFYDVDSGLVPPKWTGWTAIENRNKVIGAIGNNLSHVAEPAIENNARPILPNGFDSLTTGQLLIADRIRHLKPDGWEPPYISGWAVVYNAAFVIAPTGFNAASFGNQFTEKTRRYYERVGNWDSLVMGQPMIADRVRTLDIESRYGINPPYIPLPTVDLHTRYLDEVGKNDYLAFGSPSLSIHWTIITPRWTHRDYFGEARLHNVTPELYAFGRDSQEFGNTNVRLQWRPMQPDGSNMQLFGSGTIAYRDRQFSVSGFNAGAIGDKLKVIKTGAPPYSTQYIWLDAVEIDGEKSGGHGIEPPPELKKQVSNPFVRSNVIAPDGFIATRMGSHYTQSNGIIVEIGIPMPPFGSLTVGLKNRSFSIDTIGDSVVVGKPSLSPYTIYATKNVTQQAITNHPLSGLFYDVGSSPGIAPAGERFGNTILTLQHRAITRCGTGIQSAIGSHKIRSSKHFIDLSGNGFRSYRTGFHSVGPFELTLIQYDSIDSAAFGATSIIQPTATKTVRAIGGYSQLFGICSLQSTRMELKPKGFNAELFGMPAKNPTPFMWQGLRIGELVLGNYGGFDASAIGNIFISNKVRGIDPTGFDAFICEYDYTNFNKRMRVTKSVIEKPKQYVSAVGFVTDDMGVLNIKPAAHYIRPDGNAEQYRKGGW